MEIGRFAAAVLAMVFLSGLAIAAEEGSLEPGMTNPGYHEKPSWFKNSFLDLREDVAEAAADGKRVMLYFYQDGCPYCEKLLRVNFGAREINDFARAHFDVIAINIWGDREVTDLQGMPTTEKQFSESMKVMFTPTMLYLDDEGNTVLRQNGYYPPHKFTAALEYSSDSKHQAQSFRDYFAARDSQPALGHLHEDESFLQPPLQLAARDSGKPLVVMFEQQVCLDCDELHLDILKRPLSQELLARFDVALLDTWSKDTLQTPAGEEAKVVDWAGKLGVNYTPTMIFFDADGKEVFRSEGYLKSFHVQSILEYVADGVYREQPNFQRFVQARAERLEAEGVHVDLMN